MRCDLLQRLATLTSRLDFQQLKGKQMMIESLNEKPQSTRFHKERSGTDPDVEAQQIADHSRDGRQDDHSGEVVDQRVHSQAQQPERSIQLLGEGGGGANQRSRKLRPRISERKPSEASFQRTE